MLLLVVVASLVVGVGLWEMPYSFYMLLRTTLCLTSVVGFIAARRMSVDSATRFL